jgi:NAD(P)-dependent dehydrogenase (short-subunit alcohol dehydrogenase family)
MTQRICEGQVAIVTGAGRGIGRAEALELARQGAKVVVNDLGTSASGEGTSAGPAQAVVEEIKALGGEAIANGADVGDYDAAAQLVQSAIDAFGALHILVNNAGFLRDRLLVNMSPQEWDDVVRVHLRGLYAVTHHAAKHWRALSKQRPVMASVINTSSGSGLYGMVGQSNYGAAKAGVASFTVIVAQELSRYGVTVNAIAPAAVTRLTEKLVPEEQKVPEGAFNPLAPKNVAPLVAWLASAAARGVTGRVFNVGGGAISVADQWAIGAEIRSSGPWDGASLDAPMKDLLARARPQPDYLGRVPSAAS